MKHAQGTTILNQDTDKGHDLSDHDDGRRLSEVLSRVRSQADGKVSVSALVDAVGDLGMLPLILLPALIAATPLSGIPGVTAVAGITIAILSAELLAGLRKVHLPGTVRRKSIDGDKLRHWIGRVEPVVDWIERHTRKRLTFLFHRPMVWVPQLLCLLTGLAMPFLELIPFSGSIAAISVCLLTLAMLTGDGIFFLIALLPYGTIGYLIFRFLV